MGDNNLSLIGNQVLDQSPKKDKPDLLCLAEQIKCDFCDFTTDSKYMLSKYKKNHVKIEGFLCQICPKIFLVKNHRFSRFPVKNSSFFKTGWDIFQACFIYAYPIIDQLFFANIYRSWLVNS